MLRSGREVLLKPLGLEPLSKRLPAFTLFLYRGLFIVASLFDLSEQAVFLELSLEGFKRLLQIVSIDFYIHKILLFFEEEKETPELSKPGASLTPKARCVL